VPDVLFEEERSRREDVMSGDLAPAKRTRPEPIEAASHESRTRVRLRLGYLLALVWVVVGSVLYAVEVARLVIGSG
jgi:hypothetical protein